MLADPQGELDLLIWARGLRKAFGSNRVLGGIDLDVRSGEAVALLGANGAGKTTLLRVAATLVRPTGGAIRVAGADCAREPEAARRQLGFLGHGSWLYEDLTALLMSTHSFGRGFSVADRAAILCGGRIAADVPVAPLGAEGVRRLYEVTVEEGA